MGNFNSSIYIWRKEKMKKIIFNKEQTKDILLKVEEKNV